MWQVIIDVEPKINDFRQGYFPRKTHYKREAQALVREVVQKGGKAHIEKVERQKLVNVSKMADAIRGFRRLKSNG
jgi:hypothetical protein